jgi:hypothetical protein
MVQAFLILKLPKITNTKIVNSKHESTQQDFVRAPFHTLWRAWFLRIFARAKADTST